MSLKPYLPYSILLIILLFIFSVTTNYTAAQNGGSAAEISRQYFHYQVDEAQKDLLAKDGSVNNTITIYENTAANKQLTASVTTRIDSIQQQIEFSKILQPNQKIVALRGLADLLNNFGKALALGKARWQQLPLLISCFQTAMNAHLQGKSVLPPVQQYNFGIAQTIAENIGFEGNIGGQALREWAFFQTIKNRPDDLLKELSKNMDFSFADSLIVVAAHTMPEALFTYAQARHTPMGRLITETAKKDSLVRIVEGLSYQRTGQMYLPFVQAMYRGKVAWSDINLAINFPEKYYKLLVSAQLDALANANGAPPMGTKALNDMLKQKTYELFVNTINGLHDAPAGIRFRKIQNLNTAELYYLIVYNEETIYTSSYLYVYKRMFETMKTQSADSLMNLMHFDHYKKFITMASNYNTLNDFLGKMSQENANAMMANFVSGLENGTGSNDIEDAVDVANAYTSINNPQIMQLMLSRIMQNRNNAQATGNKKAEEIYKIEQLLMQSNAQDSSSNVTDSLGIPPVYQVKNEYLRDTLGRIIMHMFFLDDGTGKGSFNTLTNLYSNRKEWAMQSTPYWVQYTSIGTPVPFILFANRPLNGATDKDEQAQKELLAYMQDSSYDPTITVHRGHSFSLKYTINKMQPSSKIVVLGSCGAYQSLADILKKSPDSYIISSKQVGIGEINVALFQYLVENLKKGKDIDWQTMMDAIRKQVLRKDGYDDYIFPQKNLGVQFIKAYKIAMENAKETW